jgi:hypothetical protein
VANYIALDLDPEQDLVPVVGICTFIAASGKSVPLKEPDKLTKQQKF